MCCTVSYIDVFKLTLNNMFSKIVKQKTSVFFFKITSLFTIDNIGNSSLLFRVVYYHVSLTLLSLAVSGDSERLPPEFDTILSN